MMMRRPAPVADGWWPAEGLPSPRHMTSRLLVMGVLAALGGRRPQRGESRVLVGSCAFAFAGTKLPSPILPSPFSCSFQRPAALAAPPALPPPTSVPLSLTFVLSLHTATVPLSLPLRHFLPLFKHSIANNSSQICPDEDLVKMSRILRKTSKNSPAMMKSMSALVILLPYPVCLYR